MQPRSHRSSEFCPQIKAQGRLICTIFMKFLVFVLQNKPIAVMFGREKLEWCGYRKWKRLVICLTVLTEYWRSAKGQTDILCRETKLYFLLFLSLMVICTLAFSLIHKSQQEKAKLPLSLQPHPLTHNHKILYTWLRSPYLPTCDIWSRSPQGLLLTI